MTTQAQFESRWLAYARKVMTVPCGCECDRDTSWPGYIGKDYELGRVLLVGAIHNAPVLRNSGIFEILPDIDAFKRSPPGEQDHTYLRIVRNAYLAAIPKWATYPNG
jgi:hypothetical protein